VLVPPGDPEALADALRQLAADPAALARLRGAARELAAAQFAPAQVVTPLLRLLRPVPPPGPASGPVPGRR
jgi:glycosyltransferase involved in cell wall biosynthesis